MVNLRNKKILQWGIRTPDLESIIFTTYSNQENSKIILSPYFGLIDMEEWGHLSVKEQPVHAIIETKVMCKQFA